MEFDSFDVVTSLQALPETDPVEIEGISLGRNPKTCQAWCTAITVNVIQTVLIGGAC